MPLIVSPCENGDSLEIQLSNSCISALLSDENEDCTFIEEVGYFGYEDYSRMLVVPEIGDCLPACLEDKYCIAASLSDVPFGRRCLLYTKLRKMQRVKDSLSTLWTRVCKTGTIKVTN